MKGCDAENDRAYTIESLINNTFRRITVPYHIISLCKYRDCEQIPEDSQLWFISIACEQVEDR